jgi:hypothetical protein
MNAILNILEPQYKQRKLLYKYEHTQEIVPRVIT